MNTINKANMSNITLVNEHESLIKQNERLLTMVIMLTISQINAIKLIAARGNAKNSSGYCENNRAPRMPIIFVICHPNTGIPSVIVKNHEVCCVT
jgi:hypothetical protein